MKGPSKTLGWAAGVEGVDKLNHLRAQFKACAAFRTNTSLIFLIQILDKKLVCRQKYYFWESGCNIFQAEKLISSYFYIQVLNGTTFDQKLNLEKEWCSQILKKPDTTEATKTREKLSQIKCWSIHGK